MMTKMQQDRMLQKLQRFETTLKDQMFLPIDTVDVKAFHTKKSFNTIPNEENFHECKTGDMWDEETSYCWMEGSYTVPHTLDGNDLFIWPRVQAYEGMLWVDGCPYGNFANKIIEGSHGNHYCNLLKSKVSGGQNIDIAIEFYSGHQVIGTQPFTNSKQSYKIIYGGIDICTKDAFICDTYYKLKIVNQMIANLPNNSFRKAELIQTMLTVHQAVYYDSENIETEVFRARLETANDLLTKVLDSKNSASAPFAGIIGHSHMDTAWLWHREETEKKCARTFSNQLSFMEQYPEYTFIQSSAYHIALMERLYPDIYNGMKAQIASGRYEPNGAVWVECDCNLPGGEYLIRQFLWGQNYTREKFGYTSDSFWLPDTFGYSAALPQIMKGCRVDYFLTTKIDWNDTNVFPYESFWWKGIDGSKILVHFNRTHFRVEPEKLLQFVSGDDKDAIKEKTVSNMRLLSYGFGDGGGGPEFESIEMGHLLSDIEGLPRTEHVTVSGFMKKLEQSLFDPSEHSGELYLELHRGTLTNQHQIKRNNRLAEIALHNLELAEVIKSVESKTAADNTDINPLMEEMLVNQFHDILPGTCIPRVHDESLAQTAWIIESATRRTEELLTDAPEEQVVSLLNPLSFSREDVVYLSVPEEQWISNYDKQQRITDLNGASLLAVSGVKVEALSSKALNMCAVGPAAQPSAFSCTSDFAETPFFQITFNEKMYIESLIDKRTGRELKGSGYALNTLLVAEDVSAAWDNWDVDADCEYKFEDTAKLLDTSVVSNGSVELRIRSKYQLTSKSTLRQDMIFYADSPAIVFESEIDWNDDHRFLKTAFDTTIQSEYARNEIQFGNVKRPTVRNTSYEKAKFEVCNHKFTDLSETRYGVSVLNDSKYGISVKDSQIRLSLHKGGNRPDYRGDKGVHFCKYAFLAHMGDFNARNVVQPAYCFNYPVIKINQRLNIEALLSVSSDNIIIEAIKPCEETQRAFIVRLYECEGTYTKTELTFSSQIAEVFETNMLEEDICKLEEESLVFSPFEIKTLKILY